MTEAEELLEDLQNLAMKLDDLSSQANLPAPLIEAKEALEEAINKIEDYILTA